MDTGTPADNSQPIDAIVRDAIEQADAVAGTPGVEAGGSAPDSAPPPENRARDFAQSTLATGFAIASEMVFDRFYSALEPIAGEAQAKRIATRAAMSPALQRTLTESGVLIAEKYNAIRFMGPEWVFGGAMVAYLAQLNGARKDMRKLLAAFEQSKANGVAQ